MLISACNDTTLINVGKYVSPHSTNLTPHTPHPTLVQLDPRYEGQLNPMAEHIPHEVRPLVRTHVYHPYHAADRQAETDS